MPTNQARKGCVYVSFLLFSSLSLSLSYFSFVVFYPLLLKISLGIVFVVATRLVLTHPNSSERKKKRYVKEETEREGERKKKKMISMHQTGWIKFEMYRLIAREGEKQ